LRVSVTAMINHISHTFITVLDQDEALDFYVNKLGMEVRTDADLGAMRFLTVAVPGQPSPEIVLIRPGAPMHDDATEAQLRELVSKGALSTMIIATDDCRGDYERLKAAGVEFTQEPEDRFYGIDCGFRDPFGNPIRLTQPAQGPIVVPEPGTEI
jgi:catechol 2,3-dioxygenase-like lactoylglutathione lyase family enzyme